MSHTPCGSTLFPDATCRHIHREHHFAQLRSLQRCTTRQIPIWFQYDIPTIREPREAHYTTGSRRSCASCVSIPITTPNHVLHVLRVHNSTRTTCEPPNVIFQRRFSTTHIHSGTADVTRAICCNNTHCLTLPTKYVVVSVEIKICATYAALCVLITSDAHSYCTCTTAFASGHTMSNTPDPI